MIVAFRGRSVVSGEVEYPDTLYPGRPTTFDHGFTSPAQCPRGITSVGVYADLDASLLVHGD